MGEVAAMIGPETAAEYFAAWASEMNETFAGAPSGTYCHNGGDLLADTARDIKMSLPDDETVYAELKDIAEGFIDEWIRPYCEECRN